MTKRKSDKLDRQDKEFMKKMLAEELKRRKRTKGLEKQNVSKLSGVSLDSSETLNEQTDIWGAKAGAKRNIEAEAKHYRQEEQARQEKSQAQMQQEHSKQWEALDLRQQKELGQLEQSQQTEIDQIKVEHAQARQDLAAQQSTARQQKKVEHKAQVAKKKSEFKSKKKQIWTAHMDQSEIKNIKQKQLKEMQIITKQHETARDQLLVDLQDQIREIEAQHDLQESELLNAQQQELLKISPKPGKPVSKQQEQTIAEHKEQHVIQMAELKARQAEQKSEIRSNYIYNRNDLIEAQNAEIAEIKQANKQELRNAAKPQNVLHDVNRVNQKDLNLTKLVYQTFLSNQTTTVIELKVAQLETMNVITTQHYRAKTELLKRHEDQRVDLRQSQAQERHALGYLTKIPTVDTPKIEPIGPGNNDEDEDESYNFRM